MNSRGYEGRVSEVGSSGRRGQTRVCAEHYLG